MGTNINWKPIKLKFRFMILTVIRRREIRQNCFFFFGNTRQLFKVLFQSTLSVSVKIKKYISFKREFTIRLANALEINQLDMKSERGFETKFFHFM